MPSLYDLRNGPRLQSAARLKSRREAIRHLRERLCKCGRNDPGYFPSRIRRTILATLTHQWTEWFDLLHTLRQQDPACENCPRVSHVLDFLEENHRIESVEIYNWPHSKGPRPTLEQRLHRPPGKILGHQHAYRLKPLPTDH